MGTLPSRKPRTLLVVEALEDRRLLSLSGATSAWDRPAFDVADHAELAPATFGPTSSTGDEAQAPGPESPDLDASSRDFAASTDASPTGSSTSSWSSWTTDEAADTPGDATPTVDPTPMPAAWSSDRAAALTTSAAFPSAGSVDSPSTGTSLTSWSWPASAEGSVSTAGAVGSTLPVSSALASLAGRTPGGAPSATEAASVAPMEASSRAISLGSGAIARSSVSLVTTSRVEATPSAHADSAEPSEAVGAPVPLVGAASSDPDVAAMGSSRGASTTGPGSPSASAPIRPALDPSVTREVDDGRSPDPAPPTAIVEAESLPGQSGIENLAASRLGDGPDRPDPQLADLIMSLMPIDRSSLDGIVGRFLDPMAGISATMTGSNAYLGLLASSLTLAIAVVAVDVTLRIKRSREDEEAEALVAFPGLPGFGNGAIS
jgi:hypothetical protein